jgi:hypothetical protein
LLQLISAFFFRRIPSADPILDQKHFSEAVIKAFLPSKTTLHRRTNHNNDDVDAAAMARSFFYGFRTRLLMLFLFTTLFGLVSIHLIITSSNSVRQYELRPAPRRESSGVFHDAKAHPEFAPKETKLKALVGLPKYAPPTSSIILIRALGNALPPRHSTNQTLDNLDFILAHEDSFPNTTRHWFVNRFVDPEMENQVLDRLRKAQESYTVIPFDLQIYDKIEYAYDQIPKDQIHLPTTRRITKKEVHLAEGQIQHNKILYVINVNGVRNAMLDYGRTHSNAEYILPWDGNCFMTRNAWSSIQSSLAENPQARYFKTPMDRLQESNEALLSDTYEPKPVEEPQIIFHRMAKSNFNEQLRYGRRNKVELLVRLGVPGPWDKWSWLDSEKAISDRAHAFDAVGDVPIAGWITRLNSGTFLAERSAKARGRLRNKAVTLLLERLDFRAARDLYGLTSSTLLFFNEKRLLVERAEWKAGKRKQIFRELVRLADQALLAGPWSVMDKKKFGCGISGDCHDYFHPSPYMWPQRNESGHTDWSKPFKRRDGVRAPGTSLFSSGSEQYDRSGLAAMKYNTTLLALAYSLTDNKAYVEKAASNLRHWFIHNATRMNPHLTYAQVKWKAHATAMGSSYGLIEMKDVYFFLDAVKIVEKSEALSLLERDSMREWFADYLEWLVSSLQGQQEFVQDNNHGLFYDVQVAPIALYTGNIALALSRMQRSASRLLTHINTTTGALSQELIRPTCEHYQAFTLQGWANMARMSRKIGLDYWGRFRDKATNQSILCQAMRYANPYLQKREICPGNSHSEDVRRWWPLLVDFSQHCQQPSNEGLLNVSDWIPSALRNPDIDRYLMPPMYDYGDGIAPFWNLGYHW